MTIAKTTSLSACFTLLVTLTGCGGGTGYDETPEPAPPPPPPAPEYPMTKDGLTVSAMKDSPTFAGASLTLPGLEEGATLDSGTVKFDFAVESYELGVPTSDAEGKGIANSAQGQHIHLILDNGPYSAHYEAAFEKEVEDGHHVMLAFLSRSYHESLKNAGAAVVRQFTVGEAGEDVAPADLSAPHLFYSRPKGTYSGADTERLMLDFYLLNTTLSADGNRVRATINGSEFVFTEWVPYVIEGLPAGEVTIRLELLDAEGNAVPGPFNDVTRTVTLEAADDAEGA